MATVGYAHIEIDDEGRPVIAGTGIKVRMIAADVLARGWDADGIHKAHPQLGLGQIHSALAYYHDHKEEMDRDIAERYDRVQQLRASQEDSPGRRRLRERGLIP